MSATVIAFVNFKGGVGKTANAVNIGGSLATYHRKRVLIVDLDAQSNSSLWLMKPGEWRKHTKDLKRIVYQGWGHILNCELSGELQCRCRASSKQRR